MTERHDQVDGQSAPLKSAWRVISQMGRNWVCQVFFRISVDLFMLCVLILNFWLAGAFGFAKVQHPILGARFRIHAGWNASLGLTVVVGRSALGPDPLVSWRPGLSWWVAHRSPSEWWKCPLRRQQSVPLVILIRVGGYMTICTYFYEDMDVEDTCEFSMLVYVVSGESYFPLEDEYTFWSHSWKRVHNMTWHLQTLWKRRHIRWRRGEGE